jgi:heat shock protein HtpX
MIERIQEQKNQNLIRTGLLLIGMLILLVAVGWLLIGPQGMIWMGAFGLLMAFLSFQIPTETIMRFYRARPLTTQQAPYLNRIIQQLSRKAKLKKEPQLYYIASNSVNAFATGRQSDPGIAVTHGLLRQLSAKEVTAVLAHELSHVAHNDMRLKGLTNVMGRMTRSFSLIGQILLFINLPLLVMGEETFPWLGILLLIIAPTLSTLMMLAISRTREFDADLEAARLTGDPNSLADALLKLDYINRSSAMRPLTHRIPRWMSTHPQMDERIKRLRELAPRYESRISWEALDRFLRQSPFFRQTGFWV